MDKWKTRSIEVRRKKGEERNFTPSPIIHAFRKFERRENGRSGTVVIAAREYHHESIHDRPHGPFAQLSLSIIVIR